MMDKWAAYAYIQMEIYLKNAFLVNKCVSEYQFNDVDGIIVIASLYVDNENDLFELDIWKTNYEPLKKLPYD